MSSPKPMHPMKFQLTYLMVKEVCRDWDIDFIDKLRDEQKLSQFINHIKTHDDCRQLVQEMYLYCFMSKTDYAISNIINFHRNKVYTHLSLYVYNVPYPFTDKQVNEEGISTKNTGKPNKNTVMETYQAIRTNILAQPFKLYGCGFSELVFQSPSGTDTDGFYVDF
jgi:hypothetical protein